MFPSAKFAEIPCMNGSACSSLFCHFSHSLSRKKPVIITKPVVTRSKPKTKSIIAPKQVKIESNQQPPKITPSLHSNVPFKTRQKTLDLFFKEFIRLAAADASDQATRQELDIYKSSTNLNYTPRAIKILKELRSKSCLDENRTKNSITVDQIKHLVLTPTQLKEHGYPMLEDCIGPSLPLTRKCDRCSNIVSDHSECTFHPGYIHKKTTNNGTERLYSCCLSSVGGKGCTTLVHVFSFSDTQTLASISPFKVLAESSKHDIVALDCEMSYTTTGLDLTRVTVVDADGSTLLDEIVKPLSQVIDANTRWSGLTLDQINNSKVGFDQVFGLISQLVGKNTVIVGHGLENDLKAMRV